MIRSGIFVIVLLASFSASAARGGTLESFDYNVSWTIHSSYELWSGKGGSVDLSGHGPGRLTTETFNDLKMYQMLTFGDGKTSGMAGPLANGEVIFENSNPRWTTGLPTEVESASLSRAKNGVLFTIDDDTLATFNVTFDRGAECIFPGACSGVMSWMSTLVADGTRMATVATPEPTSMAVVVAGLVLSGVLRRRRR